MGRDYCEDCTKKQKKKHTVTVNMFIMQCNGAFAIDGSLKVALGSKTVCIQGFLATNQLWSSCSL